MARRAFMIADALVLRLQHLGHVGEVDVVDARPGAVRRRRVVESDGCGRLAERLDRAHLQLGLGQPMEIARGGGHRLVDGCGRVAEILLPAGIVVRIFELLAGLDVGEKLLERALEADPLLDLSHLALDAPDFVEPDLVNLLGRQLGGRHPLEIAGIISAPFGRLHAPLLPLACGSSSSSAARKRHNRA
jgi:hypothetical protein